MFDELRTTEEAASRSGDGIELASLEGDAADRAAVALLGHYPTIRALRALGGGRAITELARDAVDAASALILITWPSRNADAYVRGGIAAQAVWLTATSLGLAVQPMSIATFLFARLESGCGEGLSAGEVRAMRSLRARFHEIFPTPSTDTEILLCRVAVADPPSVRSRRLPMEKVLDLG